MSFVARAQKSHDRGDTLRGIFILITGLRRNPQHDDALDALIDLFSLSTANTGLEHEIIEILLLRDDADDVLSVMVDNLWASSNESTAEKLLELGRESGLDYLQPEAIPEPILDVLNLSPPSHIQVALGQTSSVQEEEDVFPPPGIEYEPEAATVDLEREEVEEYIARKTFPLWKIGGIIFFIALLSVLVLYLRGQEHECKTCEDFDVAIQRWPSENTGLEAMREKHPEMEERLQFLRLLNGNLNPKSPSIKTPKTWYGIAVNGIKKNQLCAPREPLHLAIQWCRVHYFSKRQDPQQSAIASQELKLAFPSFGTQVVPDKKVDRAQGYAKGDRSRLLMHAFFTDFHGSKDPMRKEIEAFPKSPLSISTESDLADLFAAMNAIMERDAEEADRLLIAFLEKERPQPLITLIQALFSRAFFYIGDSQRAAKFSAPLGGIVLPGDADRPPALNVNPVTIAGQWWEGEEAVFSRAELLAEMGQTKKSLMILGLLKDSGASFRASRQMHEIIACLTQRECKDVGTPKGKIIAQWLFNSGDMGVKNEAWMGFLQGVPGRTLDYKPSGSLNRWWYRRLQLIAAAQHGKGNQRWLDIKEGFKATGRSADFALALSEFWQGNYVRAKSKFEGIDVPVAKGFSGLTNRALGEGAIGNKELNEAGLRFSKKGGADFELGILNLRFGQRERANGYFWNAWKQDWSRENALINWCKTLPQNSYQRVSKNLNALEKANMDDALKSRLIAIRDICIVVKGNKNFIKKIIPERNKLHLLPYWVLSVHGKLAYERGDFSASRTYFDHALLANPTDAEILFGAARCAKKDQDLPVAKSLSSRYIQLWPNGPRKAWVEELQ